MISFAISTLYIMRYARALFGKNYRQFSEPDRIAKTCCFTRICSTYIEANFEKLSNSTDLLSTSLSNIDPF